jgi:FKBP-type peptidyl-prolyl cis-trans isomerase FklB
MRVILPLLLASVLAAPAFAEEAKAPPAPAATPMPQALKDPQAQASYALGLNFGHGLKQEGIAVDPNLVARGIADALATGEAKPLITDTQMRDILTRLRADLQAKQAEKAAHAAETNKTQGEAFLKANAAKPGVTTLPSGLQYEVLTIGNGPKPGAEDTVLCNYRGALLDGTEFDSSYRRGEPSSFPVNGVIKGWTEALQQMPMGSKWRIYVPAALGYGDKGAGPDIGPNAVLVFDIELLAIQPKM